MLVSPILKAQSRVLRQVSNTSDFVVWRAVTQHAVLCCVISILGIFFGTNTVLQSQHEALVLCYLCYSCYAQPW